MFKTINKKVGMNEKDDVCSSIENHLLYKVAYLIFRPRSIWKAAVVKNLFYGSFSEVFDIFTVKTQLQC
jgi:hypothetical protein